MSKSKILLLPAVILFFWQGVYAQTKMMVQEETVTVKNITTDSMVNHLTISQKISSRTYFDGFGRASQQIGLGATPLQKDMIQPIVYDNLGRQTKSYLPYTDGSDSGKLRSGVLTAQAAFYLNGATDKVADDSMPFSRQIIENSPLQRLLQAGSVGIGFQPGEHYSAVNYRSNNTTADGSIILWLPDGTRSGSYADNSLSVTEATGPDGKKALVFADKAERTILKRQVLDATHNIDTYYIYNNAGTISYAIPPKAVKLLLDNPAYTLTQTGVAALIYKYVYDDRGRLSQKNVPGSGSLYVIYDPLDRPVLLQDANLRAANRWNFIKYDIQGRAVLQGYYTDATHTTAAAMQTYVDGMTGAYATTWYESRSSTSATGYYTNNLFPTTSATVYSSSFYDDYDMNYDASHIADYSYTAQGLTGEATPTSVTQGMMTMTRTLSLGTGMTTTWFIKAIFYDKRGNTIQVKSSNQLVNTVSDVATSVPDFTGATLQTKVQKFHAVGTSTTVLSTYSYDHMYRITAIKQKYNTDAENTVATYQYNELGQQVDKKLGINGAAFLQSVDYRYNIRGQLLSINNSKLNVDAANNDDTNDVFGEELLYDKSNTQIGSTGTFGGQLTAVKWMSLDGSNVKSNERSYKYLYDGLNRFTQAIYAERLSTATATTNFALNANGFNEKVTAYDENGNIQALQRYSSTVGGSTGTKVDGLKYTYDTNNLNKLLTVIDTTGNAAGFRNYTGSTGSYTYDAAGNLASDPYKGITSILYNGILNKVSKVTMTYPSATNRYLEYTYDPAGKVIRKRQFDNNVLQKTTDYIDGFIYTTAGAGTPQLDYFGMPEGRVRNTGGATITLKQEFIITDHQGNARISFEDNGSGVASVKQENSYYAFGLSMTSTMALPAAPNKNLYNGGAEWQNDFTDQPDWQQTFYRNYDQATGRFLAADPMADASESMTVYQYAGNNPIMMNDPMGNLQMYGGRPILQNYSSGTGDYDLPPINRNPWLYAVDGAYQDYQDGGGGDFTGFWMGYVYSNGNFKDYKATFDKLTGGNYKAGVYYYHAQDGSTDVQLSGNSHSAIAIQGENGYVFYDIRSGNSKSANQGKLNVTPGLIGVTLDELSKTKATAGSYTQRINFSYHANGWTGSQYVNTYKLGKGFSGLSTGLSIYTTGKSYYDIYNGDHSILNYSDAIVGTIGLGAKVLTYFNGVQYPVIGEGIAIYGTIRLGWDIARPMGEGNAQYLESAREEGCGICTLPH